MIGNSKYCDYVSYGITPNMLTLDFLLSVTILLTLKEEIQMKATNWIWIIYNKFFGIKSKNKYGLKTKSIQTNFKFKNEKIY